MPNAVVASAVCHCNLTQQKQVCIKEEAFTSQMLWDEVNSGYTLRRLELDFKHSFDFAKL